MKDCTELDNKPRYCYILHIQTQPQHIYHLVHPERKPKPFHTGCQTVNNNLVQRSLYKEKADTFHTRLTFDSRSHPVSQLNHDGWLHSKMSLVVWKRWVGVWVCGVWLCACVDTTTTTSTTKTTSHRELSEWEPVVVNSVLARGSWAFNGQDACLLICNINAYADTMQDTTNV